MSKADLKSYFFLVLALWPLGLFAQNLSYELEGFAGRYAILVLRGAVPAQTTATISSDGLSARISAPGVAYNPQASTKALPSLVKGLSLVAGSPNHDLIVNFSTPVELSAERGSTELRLIFKKKEGPAPKTKPLQTGFNNDSNSSGELIKDLSNENIRLKTELKSREREVSQLKAQLGAKNGR